MLTLRLPAPLICRGAAAVLTATQRGFKGTKKHIFRLSFVSLSECKSLILAPIYDLKRSKSPMAFF
jgi:hypothetical protein